MNINGNLTFAVLGFGELQNAIIERLSANPTGAAGRIYYNTVSNAYFYYNGTTWIQFASGTTSVASFSAGTTGLTPNTATTGAITLAGTLNATSGGTGFNSYTAGQLLYASSTTALSQLPPGSANQVLHSGTTPSWSAVDLAADVSGILPGTHGGTGVNNGANTITLGGNLVTTGGDITFASSAPSSVTVPASGTLLTTADTSNYVSSFTATGTGLTPSSATTGAVALSGVLNLAHGGTNANLTATAGGIVYSTASALAISAAGTSGQIVLSGGTGAPTFLTNSTPVDTDGAGSTALVVGSTFNFFGTANQITTTASAATVTFSLPSTLIAPGTAQITSDLTIGGLTFESSQTNITAHAGGGQASAFQLTKSYNVVTVVASAGDSVKLPASGAGAEITVVNIGSNALAVFPQTGDQIDGGAVNASVPVPAGGTATYQSVNAGNWYTIDPVVVASGPGLSVTYSPGETVLSNTGVTSFQTSLNGLTPSSATTGAITLAGTLGVPSGGTGATTLTLNGVLFGNGTSPVSQTAAGSQFNVLTVNGSGVPVFGQVNLAQAAAVSGILALANGGTNANLTAVAGAPVYSTASALALGTAGTSGQAYISGGAAVPTWQNVTAALTATGANASAILKGDGTGQFSAQGASFAGSGSTSGVTLNGTVTAPTDATTKAYVDAIAAGLTWKNAVRAIAVTNGTLATAFVAGNTVDGYTLVLGDRILLAGQTTGTQNGIYIVTAGTPTRSTDMALGSNADNAAVFVEEGTLYKNTGWVETADPAVVGTDALTFAQFSGGSVYTFNLGLTQVGSTVNVNTDGTTTYIDGSNNVAVDSSATAGQVLRSTGTAGTTATWGAVNLANTNAVTGTLAVGNGGTGDTTFTTHGVIVGNSTSALNVTAAGATGSVLTGNTGADPTFVALNTLAVTSITGTANEITASAAVGAVTLSVPATFIAPGSLEVTTTSKFDGLTYNSTAAVAATGTTQGTAAGLTAEFNTVTATAGNTGVELPTPAFAGVEISIVNVGAVDAKVYPATGGTIDGAGTNNAITVPAGGTWTGQASTTTQWYSIDPVVVNGTGISVTYSNGQTSISNTGVLSFSAGTTGLTPSSGTSGNVTLAGVLNPANGGTGVANNNASTLTISGNFASTFTVTGPTSVTFPTSGTLLSTANIAANAVTTFQTSLSGLTPNTATNGAVTLAGTLGVPSGGTGATTLTAHGVLLGQGTSAVTATAVGATGTVLHGNTGADPTFSAVSLTADVSGVLPVANGGTNLNAVGAVGTVLASTGTANAYTPIQYNYSSAVADGGGGPSTSFTVTHSLNQQFVNITVYDSTFNQIIPQAVVLTDANTVTVTVNSAINLYVVVMGITGVALN